MKKYISSIITLVLIAFLLTSCSVKIEDISTPDGKNETAQNGMLTVSIIDVGQGDSILIKTPGDKFIIVDSGSTNEKDKLYDYLSNIETGSIDVVVSTHPHEDHIGNLDNIIEDYSIKEVYMPKVSSNTKAFENLLKSIKQKGLKIKTAKTGVEFEIDGVKFEFLAPNNDEYTDVNNYSAVLKVSYGEKVFLLMGDAEMLSEGEILDSGADVQADVIKIGHHGSSTSSSKKFIKAVKPDYAVISCGKGNDYNHPHRETISLLNDLKIKTFRTDLNESITFVTDGFGLDYFFK